MGFIAFTVWKKKADTFTRRNKLFLGPNLGEEFVMRFYIRRSIEQYNRWCPGTGTKHGKPAANYKKKNQCTTVHLVLINQNLTELMMQLLTLQAHDDLVCDQAHPHMPISTNIAMILRIWAPQVPILPSLHWALAETCQMWLKLLLVISMRQRSSW